MSKIQSNLKLLANDEKDLSVFSAYLQDAIIIAQDIKFLLKIKHLLVFLVGSCGKMPNREYLETIEELGLL